MHKASKAIVAWIKGRRGGGGKKREKKERRKVTKKGLAKIRQLSKYHAFCQEDIRPSNLQPDICIDALKQ